MQRTQIARTAVNSLASSWSSALAKMATLQASFSDTVKSLWQGVANTIAGALTNVVQSFLQQWLTTQAEKLGLMKTDQTTSVVAYSQQGAAAAYASTSAIPVVGPELAPGAAALAMGNILAFSAKGGWDVPSWAGGGVDGMGGQIGIVHPREMILDEPAANALRNGGAGRDTYIINATDADSFVAMLKKNPGAVAQAAKSGYRNGAR